MSKKKNYIDIATDEMIIENIDIPVVDETDIVEEKPIINIKTCKVIKRISTDKVIVDFDGFGIIVPVNCGDEKYLNIKFNGTIGKPDFTYEVK